MKFTLSWLKDHIETTASVAEIARTLNAIGLEVEGIEDMAERLAGFRVAKVLTAGPHPNADKLQVLTVDAGANVNGGKPLQVVCGAPNARAGLVGVLGLPGAVVPANGIELKVAAVRGVESNGMMCSTRELELGEDHQGIIELPADAPVGTPFAEYTGSDPVFDVAITPNRPDCMGVNGIARDLIAAKLGMPRVVCGGASTSSARAGFGYNNKEPATTPAQAELVEAQAPSFPFPMKIGVEPDSGCHIFWGRVIKGVNNGPSPHWLQARLKAVGLRPISALVDITNFFSLDQARPLHVYDLAKLEGAVVARRGREGESFLALNGKDYTVTPDDCVIADDVRVLGLGGVMGGDHSGVTEATTDVLLECAWFDPEWIGQTGRRHGIASDARARFERGIDPMQLSTVIETAALMILELCGGGASEPRIAGTFPVGGYPETLKTVPYRCEMALTLGGVDISRQEQRNILGRLGFISEDPIAAEVWNMIVPTWRPDVDGWPDLVEEVVRIYGLDNVASVPLPRADGVARPTATPAQKLERRLRRAAAARGNHEAITWSFLPEADASAFANGNGGLWLLSNPISEDMKAMRSSLLPGLLSAAKRNLDRGAAGLRLFEIGRRYLRGESGTSDERLSLAVVLAGERQARGWASGKAAQFDAFDAKAEALALLAEAGAPVDSLQVMGEAGPQFHPGQSATLRLGPKNVLARFGILHPALLRQFDIDVPVAVAELFLDAIPGKKGAATFARTSYAPPALQAVTRDFAFLVPAELPAGDLVRVVRGADKANIVAARLFDDFRGQGVPDGQKSLAVEVTLQPGEKSYDEAELKAIAVSILSAAQKLGAELRIGSAVESGILT